MRELAWTLSNYFIFLVASVFLAGAQASLWFQLFGYFPPPLLWLCVLTYWCLHRRLFEGLIMTYLLVFVLNSMTTMPIKLTLLTAILLFGCIYALKDRVLWSGTFHFLIASAAVAALLPLIIFGLSFSLETTPVRSFHFFSWLMSPLLTALFSIALYPVFQFFDRVTHKEAPREAEQGLL